MNNGFTSPSTDEPLAGNPRVHVEGRENYERNNKSSDWFAHNSAATEPRPESRHMSDAAKANALKNRGSVLETLKGYPDEAGSHGSKPVQENADGIKGDSTNSINEKLHDLSISSAPKIKHVEAQESKEREQKSASNSVNHVSTDLVPHSEEAPAPARLEQPPPPARPEQPPPPARLEQPPPPARLEQPPTPVRIEQPPTRLELGGKEAAAEKDKREPVVKSEGVKTPRESRGLGRLHLESSGSWDESPPHHRLRLEGESIAQKNSTDSVTEIFVQNNVSPRWKEPKVMPETNTPRKPPPPRVNSDGLRYMRRAMNQSEMSAIMHGSPVESGPPRPSSGRKVLPHMQRSELW